MCNRYICGGFLISVSTLAGFLAGIRYTQQQNMQTMQVVQVPPQSLAPNSDTPTANKERSERSLRLPSLIALKAWLHEHEKEDNHSAPASVSSRWVIKRQHDISGHDIALQLSHQPKDVIRRASISIFLIRCGNPQISSPRHSEVLVKMCNKYLPESISRSSFQVL